MRLYLCASLENWAGAYEYGEAFSVKVNENADK